MRIADLSILEWYNVWSVVLFNEILCIWWTSWILFLFDEAKELQKNVAMRREIMQLKPHMIYN